MTRSALMLPVALLACLSLAGCGASSPSRAPENAPPPTAEPPTAAPTPAPTAGRSSGEPMPAAPRPATAARFGATGFETAEGGAPAERLIPADLGARAQFWPGNAGDVLERQIGQITHLLAGDAISSGWTIADAEALAKADQIALRVISVETAPAKDVAESTGRFASAPVDAGALPADGKWYRVRFFPGGVWKEAQLQGYLRLSDKDPQWYRVDGLIRGLYGPQTRDYQKGDLFELRATARPSAVKLYPLK